MNFAALPPEVTSGWMYSGPGSAPMLTAASAWDQLAGEMDSAAANYQAVITQLATDPWRGPAATAMTAAAAPYAQWMAGIGEQARAAATQARAAAMAFQTAHAATVPPPVIAANRANLQALVATNIVGQNTPAITANQAAYGEMWAQNAGAMNAYSAGSAAASTLTPFAEPPQNTDQAGQSRQSAAVAQSAANAAGTQTDPLVGMLENLNNFLTTNPVYQAMGFPLTNIGGAISSFGAPMFMGISPIFYLTSVIYSWFPAIAGGTPLAFTISDVAPTGAGAVTGATLAASAAPASAAPGVSAGLGRAASVGGLSVPQTWSSSGVQLASHAAPLPAGAGGFGGIPPIASVVNAPRSGTDPRNALRSKLVADLGGDSKAGAERAKGAPDLVNPLTDKERAELEGLRAELTELVMEQDAVTHLMNQAFRA
ncbi:PPE family protein [Mycobacterium sp. M1]|uniref:PPE family protein n=1 Tax=Mycolicibacter acidiphilus TaxID=2835306 RepID=A0ABS5RJI1_9MYCO|nr:PPE family protein [Mycolicibacter acidiphilus]MBS9534452.1 PPE family protein [Mycolicibacter acidiphilus]